MSITAESVLSASQLVNSLELRQEVAELAEYLNYPSFRVAVFAPFNHGKSTLLNALLGSRTLPIDLVPTTGTAIVIKYGETCQTSIRTDDGQEICAAGTEILEQFAILDGDRYMREDVVGVEVFYPHPLLAKGVELIDLPGTNDMEAQDHLVYNQLLKVDLVIQVLDARKLFTLGEVSKLQEWLINRNIKTSVFVLNFMNLLEVEDQKEVISRARYLAREFRGNLPNNINNLYRVDALPALRARIKGDIAASIQAGICLFQSALLQIIVAFSSQKQTIRLPRFISVAVQLKQELETQAKSLRIEIQMFESNSTIEIERLKQDMQEIQQSFKATLVNFENWLSRSHLLSRYQSEAASALTKNTFREWENGDFKQVLQSHQNFVMKYIYQACDRLGNSHPQPLSISFPPDPDISRPEPPGTNDPTKKSVAIATGVGWVLGGPFGGAIVAGITHAVNENTKKNNSLAWENYQTELANVCSQGAADYLERFSDQALTRIREYTQNMGYIFALAPTSEPPHITEKRHQLNELISAIANLEQWLHSVEC